MKRRVYLRFLCAGGAVLLLGGHSPYRQWDVYRKARLVLLVSATDETSVRLAQALVAIFAHRLPESRATYARARDTNDLVRLIASKQLEVALLREGDAHAVFTGAEPFADNGRVALRTLGALGEHLFVCLEEVPKAAAYMLVEALAERWRDLDAALVPTGKWSQAAAGAARAVAPGCSRVLPGSHLICDAPEVADKTGETAGFSRLPCRSIDNPISASSGYRDSAVPASNLGTNGDARRNRFHVRTHPRASGYVRNFTREPEIRPRKDLSPACSGNPT